MKTLFNKIYFILLISIISFSCNTDFDINAPYKTIPIVYGLLDQSLDTQFIKINKSFIGSGNNTEYAGINDSVLFKNISARIEETINGNVSNTYYLDELWTSNIDNGIFYSDSQKIFYFVPNSLNEDAEYKLLIDAGELNETISAETNLIEGSGLNFDYLFKLNLTVNGIQFADVNLGTIDVYYDPQVKWKTASKGKRYELLMNFKYKEYTTIGAIENKSISWNLSAQKSISSDGDEDMLKNINGEAFYEMIVSKLDGYANEAIVTKRVIEGVEFTLSCGNEDLNTYMEVNEPATGVVTERPSFTNIEGGIGLFASKYQVIASGHLNNGSVLELCKGQLTSGFKFCSDSSSQIISISNLTGGVDVGCQ